VGVLGLGAVALGLGGLGYVRRRRRQATQATMHLLTAVGTFGDAEDEGEQEDNCDDNAAFLKLRSADL
jgi:hypothetical protein